jgi:hypothetical protein
MKSMSPDKLPDFHFLFIAPNLGAEWLFDAGRTYWETFQPTVISNFELVKLIPANRTVAVTIVCRRDYVANYQTLLIQARPDALIDPLAYDFFDDAKLALEGRAALGQPFGVPLAPTATFPPAPTVQPASASPTPLSTRAPGGFVTQTPTPKSK